MRVIYLTPGCFDKGGISRYSRYQIKGLREIYGPSNVRVLSLLGPGRDSFEDPFDVEWHGTQVGRASISNKILFAARALWLAKSWRPAVVHAAHVNFGPLLSLAGRVAGAATFLNVYGLEIWSGLNARRKTHLTRASAVIADSHFTARYIIEERLRQTIPTVIWDCVDLERFTPGQPDPKVLAKYGLPDPSRFFTVLTLGRLAKAAAHKGFDRLIEVVASLAPEIPQLRLVIAGQGDARPQLEALADSRSVRDRIVFTGPVNEKDLPCIYRAADVFSLVSDRGVGRGEGIPLTPLEAMACGVPVIVGNEDGSREAVADGRNGFVISPRNLDDHRSLLKRLIHDKVLLDEAAREARRIAEENFSYDGFVAKHRAFYNSFERNGCSTQFLL
jgi:phosphatidyl-myo-inositol dimannoside synthase